MIELFASVDCIYICNAHVIFNTPFLVAVSYQNIIHIISNIKTTNLYPHRYIFLSLYHCVASIVHMHTIPGQFLEYIKMLACSVKPAANTTFNSNYN